MDKIKRFFGAIFMSTAKARQLEGATKKIYRIICFIFALFFLYCAAPPFLGYVEVQWKRGIFLLGLGVMIFIKYPMNKRPFHEKTNILDWTLVALTIISFGYWILNFKSIISRIGRPTQLTIVMATIAIFLCFEMCRRVLGWVLPILGAVVVAYATLGDAKFLPVTMRSPGFSWAYFSSYSFGTDGIFGFILGTTVNYIVLFVIFGALLGAVGADKFFIDFPYALTCGRVGGPGKMAVLASGLFGSISGSATANTAATGAFTIPLMKKAGFAPEVAGAIEPAASTGGMFMPPVMGAGAFIMAEMLGLDYGQIVIIGIAPAIIYFLSVYMIVHQYALGHENISVVPKEERPSVMAVFKDGFYYMFPIILLIVLLIQNKSANRAIFYVIISTIIISFAALLIKTKENRGEEIKKFFKSLLNGFIDGADGAIIIGALIGIIGLVVATVQVTGLAFSFTSAVMSLSEGRLFVAIILILLAAYVLGMGLTVTSAYILCAIVAVSALTKLGVPAIAAHFMIFWFSQTSNVSPPVCVAAYVGAGIAGAHPYKVGFNALRFSAFIFILPLWFVYSDILMPNGLTASAVFAMVNGALATYPYAVAVTGYLYGRLNWIERVIALGATILFLFPEIYSSIAGVLIMAGMIVYQRKKNKRTAAI